MSDTGQAAPPPQPPADTPLPGAPRRRAPPWMKIVLIVSLAINLAVGGYAAARVIAGPRFVSAGPAASMMDARKLLWALPRGMRHAMRDEFRAEHFDEMMEHRRRWNDARQELAGVLSRPDASDQDIRAAYRRLGEIEADASLRMRELVGELTLRVPRDARATFADRMGHDHRHFPPWHGRGDD